MAYWSEKGTGTEDDVANWSAKGPGPGGKKEDNLAYWSAKGPGPGTGDDLGYWSAKDTGTGREKNRNYTRRNRQCTTAEWTMDNSGTDNLSVSR